MADLKRALGTDVDLTVFRKLRDLAYHTSYSHRGRYYTLDKIARFDELGLWSLGSVWFSKHGTLVRTAEILVGSGICWSKARNSNCAPRTPNCFPMN